MLGQRAAELVWGDVTATVSAWTMSHLAYYGARSATTAGSGYGKSTFTDQSQLPAVAAVEMTFSQRTICRYCVAFIARRFGRPMVRPSDLPVIERFCMHREQDRACLRTGHQR